MNRSTWTRSLLVVSLALNLGVVAAFIARPSAPPPLETAAGPAQLNLQDYLGLSAEQRRQWRQLEPAFLRELAANWQDIRRHREALVRQIFAAASDRRAIDAEQAAIASLQGAQQQLVIAQLLAERELLDAPQRRRLMDLLLSRYSREATEEERLHRD
jgi:Spy/CpxP family protein refolding chaperone